MREIEAICNLNDIRESLISYFFSHQFWMKHDIFAIDVTKFLAGMRRGATDLNVVTNMINRRLCYTIMPITKMVFVYCKFLSTKMVVLIVSSNTSGA